MATTARRVFASALCLAASPTAATDVQQTPQAAALRGAAATAAAETSSSGLPHGHPIAGKEYPQHPGFTLWLVEEFEEPLDLNRDPIWTWSDGGLNESQVRFTMENLVFEDGKLKINVLENSASLQPVPQSCSYAETEQGMTQKRLTSGELRTRHNMFRYGRYEVRMKAPSIQPGDSSINGNYVSTMFAYRDSKFKHWREIDVEVTGDTKNSLTMNVLFAEDTDLWSPEIQSTKKFEAEGVNVREEFHDFAFEWLPTGITWYFDGEVMGTHGPTNGLPIPDLSTKIMMNLWIFGESYGFGGAEGYNNQYPMHSEYDWFRFYKWNSDSSYPCDDASTSCLTDDDKYLSANNPCDGIAQVGLRGGAPSCTAGCPYPGLPASNCTGAPIYP